MIKKNKTKKSGPLLIIIIAVILAAFGLLRICLGFFGEESTAIITSIRRQGGERNETIPNRYTYSIGYTFITTEGSKIDGSVYKIGGPAYIKPSQSNPSIIPVKYFKRIPMINAPKRDTGLAGGNLILIAAGTIIFLLLRPKI